MSEPVYLGLSIRRRSRTLMHKFLYDHVKAKHGEKEKPCYMKTDSFTIDIKTVDIHKEIADDIEIRSDTL